METRIEQANATLLKAIKYEEAGQYDRALMHYREAAERMITILHLHLDATTRKKLQSQADEAIKRGSFIKKKLEEQALELKKAAKRTVPAKGLMPVEFTIGFECADFYRGLADKFYADVVNKERPKKDLLQSAINAHIVEAEIKQYVTRGCLIR